MKGGIFKKLYMKVRLFLSGLEFPVQDTLFSCKIADFQGALAQSREGDCLQIVHVSLDRKTFAAYVYNISINRIIGKIGKQLTQDLLRIFKTGFCLDGELVEISKDSDGYFCAEVKIFSKTTYMRPYLEDLTFLTAAHND